jgi:F0F1-type ATP synthase assembly protein I
MSHNQKNALANPLWALSGLGAELFGGIAGMGLVGWVADRFLVGSGHTWLLIGLVIGIIGGGANFIRQALSLNRRAAEEYRRAAKSRPKADVPKPAREKGAHKPSKPGQGWFESESEPDEDEANPR